MDGVRIAQDGQKEQGTRGGDGGGRGWYRGSCQERLYLDGGPGESGQLFNVRPFLPDDGTHRLGWDEEIHNLLLWILEGQDRTRQTTSFLLGLLLQALNGHGAMAGCRMGFFWGLGRCSGEAGGMTLNRVHTNYTTTRVQTPPEQL